MLMQESLAGGGGEASKAPVSPVPLESHVL